MSLLYILDYPLKFFMEITIPPADEESYDHKLLILWPVFGGIFLYANFWNLIVSNPWLNLVLIPILASLLILFVFKRPSTDRSPTKYHWLVCILSSFCSLLWNKFASSLLVCIFRTLGFVLWISVPYLGFVFLAAGNSLPDGLATISLATLG